MQSDRNSLKWPVLGSLSVAVLSPVLILATGFEPMDMIVLVASLIVFWALTRLSKREMGICWGKRRFHVVAVVYPIVIAVIVTGVAVISGNGSLGEVFTAKTLGRLAFMFGVTLPGVLITEEGFFRGWLWGSLERAGVSAKGTIIWSSLVFMLWHVPTATILTGFKLPPSVIPVYLANVIAIGMTWGVLRAASGSILVPSICHSVWNALAYVYFGYGTGTKAGALEVSDYHIYGPERGYIGLLLNLITLGLFWRWWKRMEGEQA